MQLTAVFVEFVGLEGAKPSNEIMAIYVHD